MARYKVLAGCHIQADTSQEPAEVKDPSGKVTLKYPSATFRPGDVFASDVDMVAKHGAEKFQLVGGSPEPYDPPLSNPAKFPGGQVSSGIQGGEAAEAKKRDQEGAEGDSDKSAGHIGRQLTPQETADRNKARQELNKKSYAELVDIARQEKIDLKGASKKEDVIQAILNK